MFCGRLGRAEGVPTGDFCIGVESLAVTEALEGDCEYERSDARRECLGCIGLPEEAGGGLRLGSAMAQPGCVVATVPRPKLWFL